MDASVHSPVLVNELGHLAGVIAFAAFLLLLDRGARLGGHARLSAPAAAAALALLWNLGSLIVLLLEPSNADREIVASVSFAVLSMLPGVLLHLALGTQYRWLRTAGYLTGAAAALFHLLEGLGIAVGSHELAIDLVTYGFGALASVFVFLLVRRGTGDRRPAMRGAAALSLFLLAGSFLHFEAHPGPASWTHELLLHHAAIPLALFVLLQDHRFLLVDAFVRWLGAALLAGGFAGALLAGLSRVGWRRIEEAGAPGLAALGVAATLAILTYPLVRDAIGRRIEPALFPRGDLAAALARLRAVRGDEKTFADQAARVIAEFASSQRWRLAESEEAAVKPAVEALDEQDARPGSQAQPWAEVAVALRLAPGRSRTLWLGPRRGGRRFLGADLRDLERLAEETAIRLESLRRAEQQRLLAEAELQALRAQINPHFLFNAFNALYGAIPRSASGARQTLLDLADILRYSLDSRRQYVAVEEELRVVEAYLAIERLRLQDRLSVKMRCDDAARSAKIPAFTVQPLVENAVKHGISGKERGGEITVDLEMSGDGLSVAVADDGVGFDADRALEPGHGLHNVRRRIELCYGAAARFTVESSGAGTRVGFQVPATAPRTEMTADRPAVSG